MNLFWSSRIGIHGLKHFAIVNEYISRGEKSFLLVSVLDKDINCVISENELEKSKDWSMGLIDFKKANINSKIYLKFKSLNKTKEENKIFLNESSPFYIS
tara:strand:- start:1078 stop:1377 length:300 start_codon:yes stop_codon:yes gene_type:complete